MHNDDEWAARRRRAALRLPALWCGCHDPEEHYCVDAPRDVIEGRPLESWRAARDHLAREGYRAILPAKVRELLGERAA
jgi:hypothetical protein